MNAPVRILVLLAAGLPPWSMLRAQETTVPAPAPAAPATNASPVVTGEVHKPPRKGGAGSLFQMSGSTTNGGMTITSDQAEYDYSDRQEQVIAFDGHVHVVDPQYDLKSDRLLVFTTGTNQIKRIIAIGNVDISQPGRHATCERATYEQSTGQAVLTGNPVLTRGSDRAVGTKITIWLNDQRVLVEGGFRGDISPETMKNRDAKP
jgi:lipopolysaccharide export system protein LptA